MRNGLLGSITVLLAGAGVSLGQMLPAPGPATASQPGQAEVSTQVPAPAAAPLGAGLPTPSAAQIPVSAAAPAYATPASVVAANAEPGACEPATCPGDPPYRPDCPGLEPAEPTKDEPEPACHFWVSGEYMLWNIKKDPISVPLVTTGSTTTLGAIGAADTVVLLGDTSVKFGNFNSGRWTIGFGGPGELLGVEVSGFFLEKQSVDLGHFASDAAGNPLLARPVNNPIAGETIFLVAAPGEFSGNISASASSRLWGTEVNCLGSLYRSLRFNADMLLGLRYLDLEEDLDIVQNTTLLVGGGAGLNGTPLPTGANLVITDRFGTRNQFYGGQVGLQGEVRLGKLFFLYAQGKAALGTNHEVLSIDGSTTQTSPIALQATVPGGLLAVSSNSGTHTQDVFAVVPEGSVNIGCQITKNIFASVGYTFMYWSDVLRPGEQVNRTVNPGLVPSSQAFGTPGPAEPSVSFHHTDFWAYGLSAGLSIRF